MKQTADFVSAGGEGARDSAAAGYQHGGGRHEGLVLLGNFPFFLQKHFSQTIPRDIHEVFLDRSSADQADCKLIAVSPLPVFNLLKQCDAGSAAGAGKNEQQRFARLDQLRQRLTAPFVGGQLKSRRDRVDWQTLRFLGGRKRFIGTSSVTLSVIEQDEYQPDDAGTNQQPLHDSKTRDDWDDALHGCCQRLPEDDGRCKRKYKIAEKRRPTQGS